MLTRRHASVTERSMGDASNRQLQHLRRYLRSLGLAHRRAHPRGGREERLAAAHRPPLRIRAAREKLPRSKKRACASRTSTLLCWGSAQVRGNDDETPTTVPHHSASVPPRLATEERKFGGPCCRGPAAGSWRGPRVRLRGAVTFKNSSDGKSSRRVHLDPPSRLQNSTAECPVVRERKGHMQRFRWRSCITPRVGRRFEKKNDGLSKCSKRSVSSDPLSPPQSSRPPQV